MGSADDHTGRRRKAPVVLVVEDDPDVREMVCGVLSDAGYAVLEADDGTKALRLLLADGTSEPTLILLDLWLPGMTGLELLKVLKSYVRLSHIPVILTSAGPRYIDGESDAAWLPKPFDADRLVALVNERAGVCPRQDDSGFGYSS